MFEAIKTWVETESDTIRPDDYPNIVPAVLDCNAKVNLLTLTKMLVPLHRARSRSSSPEGGNVASPWSHDIPFSATMEDPAVVEYWVQRDITAFEHCQDGERDFVRFQCLRWNSGISLDIKVHRVT